MPSESEVLDSMRHIIDPDLGRDIVSLGFIKDLKIDGGTIQFKVELTTPACPVKEEFRKLCHAAVSALPGVTHVDVSMSAMEPKKRAGGDTNLMGQISTIVAVSSCKGGVGKSTVAAQLARAMQREGHSIGLLDADIYGPSIPTLFNVQNPSIRVENNTISPVEIDGLKVMSLGFLLGEAPAVLRGPIVSGYIQQIMRQTNWGKLDYLLIDMPPGTGDIQLTIVQTVSLDGAIIVTTPQALSLVDVARGILMFEKVNVPVLGIVENMSYFVCDGCAKKHFIFGSSSQTLKQRFGLSTLAQLPILHGVSNLDPKDGPREFDEFKLLADNVHREIGKRRLTPEMRPVLTVYNDALRVEWPEGGESVIFNRDLRAACRCARCIDEMSGAQILQMEDIPSDIRIESMEILGNYAVGIVWNDGHSTGIYSWELMKSLSAAKVTQA
jgi:ATP-binding protein involved in chromosome partitioning